MPRRRSQMPRWCPASSCSSGAPVVGSAPSRSQPGASSRSPSPRLENEQKPPPCVSVAPTDNTPGRPQGTRPGRRHRCPRRRRPRRRSSLAVRPRCPSDFVASDGRRPSEVPSERLITRTLYCVLRMSRHAVIPGGVGGERERRLSGLKDSHGHDLNGSGRGAHHAPAVRGCSRHHREHRPVQRGRHIFPRAAVERGSFDHDAFRVRVEIHTRINQAQGPRAAQAPEHREGTHHCRRPPEQ